jgi:hypothetical protein
MVLELYEQLINQLCLKYLGNMYKLVNVKIIKSDPMELKNIQLESTITKTKNSMVVFDKRLYRV